MSDIRPQSRDRLRGSLAALTGLGVGEIIARSAGATSPVDGTARLIIDHVPVPVVELTVRTLGRHDKRATRAGVVMAAATAGTLVQGRRSRTIATVLMSAAGGVLSVRRPPRRRVVAGVAALASAGTTMLCDRSSPLVRRSIAVAAVAGLTGLTLRTRPDGTPRPTWAEQPSDGAEGWPGATPLITPTDDFYVTDVNVGPPRVATGSYRLTVGGAVDRPMELHLAELRDLVDPPFTSVLVCIHNRIGGSRLGNAVWTGVPFERILDLVSPDADATFVTTTAVDGFRATLPMELLTGESRLRAWLVLDMNGSPLTPSHGAPVRFLVPGVYGQYNGAKWLTELTFHRRHPGDYWTPRGWPHGPVPVRPQARLDRPTIHDGDVIVTGVAWAPPFGVRSVEVSSGEVSVPAELAAEVSPSSWRRFRARLQLPSGRHQVRARCTAGNGTVQDERPRPPFPVGATGVHRVPVDVP